jgi:hypothetical protein
MRVFPVAALLFAWAGAARADVHVLAELKSPENAFIDDPFAISDDGQRIAYLTTDGASRGTLHFGEPGAETTVGGLPLNVTALHWLGPARVLVVTRDAAGEKTAQAWGQKGAEPTRLGPFAEIGIAAVDGKPAVVAYAHKGGHVVAAYQPESLRPLARKLLREDKDGRVALGTAALKPLWWGDTFRLLVGVEPGEYDKNRDMQRPDRLVRVDVFGGKRTGEQEIEDVIAFRQLVADHHGHDFEDLFVRLSDDRSRLELIDGLARHPIELPRALSIYDAATLAYQTLADGRILLSLTVDPTNPAALARKKADRDDIDVYLVDRARATATPALRLDGRGRPSAWRVAGKRLALLRKHKGFDRGGLSIEVYELP